MGVGIKKWGYVGTWNGDWGYVVGKNRYKSNIGGWLMVIMVGDEG